MLSIGKQGGKSGNRDCGAKLILWLTPQYIMAPTGYSAMKFSSSKCSSYRLLGSVLSDVIPNVALAFFKVLKVNASVRYKFTNADQAMCLASTSK